MKYPDGKTIAKICRDTFGTEDVTKEQLNYILQMLTPSSYALEHHRIKGKPMMFYVPDHNPRLLFNNRPWQVDILNSDSSNLVVMKARQLGLSEIGILRCLAFADKYSFDHVKCLYTFPTLKQMVDFSKSRIAPLFEEPYYKSILDPQTNSQEYKKIRNSSLFFRTGSKASVVEGVDIDYAAVDEYDRMMGAAIDSIKGSLHSSIYHMLSRWSTPTVPHTKIHKLYEQSTMKVYLHRCEHCGKWQELSYNDYDENEVVDKRGNILCRDPKGVDLLAQEVKHGTYDFVCKYCGKPISRWEGKWVAKHPERSAIEGFYISSLNAVWCTADFLKQEEIQASSTQYFYNYTLGMPYENTAFTITESDILNNRRDYLPKPLFNRGDYRFIQAGIDFGNFDWVTVFGQKDSGAWDCIRIFHVRRDRSGSNVEQDLQQIYLTLSAYSPDMIVCDCGDSGSDIAKLQQMFGKGVVWGVRTKSSPKSTSDPDAHWNESSGLGMIDKLTQVQRLINDVKMGRIGFYQSVDQELQILIKHYSSVIIRDELDERTNESYRVVTYKGNKQGINGDHLFYSSLYACLGLRKLVDDIEGDKQTPFSYSVLDNVDVRTDIWKKGY